MLALLFVFVSVPFALGNACDVQNRGMNCDTGESKQLYCCPQLPAYELFRMRSGQLQTDLIKQIALGHPYFDNDYGNIASAPDNMISDSVLAQVMPVNIYIYHLWDIDSKSPSFKMHYKISASWRDCRVMQNCSSSIGIQSTHPYFYKFWVPVFEFAERLSNDDSERRQYLELDQDGMVTYTEERVSTFRCAFDFTDYPFDTQTCTIKLTSKSLLSNKVKLQWQGDGVTSRDIINGGWEVGSQWTTFDWEKQWLGAAVIFKRRYRTEVLEYIIPTMTFWFGSWVGLLIDCHAVPARAAMAIIPVLILTNKMNALQSALPRMSNTNRVELYLILVLLLLCVHLVELGVVNFAMRRERELKAAAIDKKQDDETSAQDQVQLARFDRFVIWFLGRSLNMHLRWISFLLFLVITIACLAA